MIALTVFLAGAAVMALEVVGTRVLRPAFGSGLHVWAALISVTLLALASGYFLGGWLADRRPRRDLLGLLLLGSGAATLAVALLGPVLLGGLADLEPRTGALLGALVLFAPPLTGLGMVSPAAVRLAARSVGRVGRTAGCLYGVGTLGSVGGTLTAAFLLVPRLPHRAALLLVAALVAAWGGVLLAGRRRALALLVLLPALATRRGTPIRPPGVLLDRPGAHGRLTVLEAEGERYLFVDGACQSHVPADAAAAVTCPYIRTFERLLWWRPLAERIYVTGLGGGALVRLFAPYEVRLVVADLDPRLPALGPRYFGWRPTGRVSLYRADGRRLLRRLPGPFDAVIVDLLTVDALPVHLYTREAFREARAKLAPRGILALNSARCADPDGVRASASLYLTLRSVFPHVRCYHAHDDPVTGLQNRIFFAAAAPFPEDPPGDPFAARRVRVQLRGRRVRFRWRNAAGDPCTEEAPGLLLTDAFAPLDLLLATTSDAYRRLFRRRFPAAARLAW